MVSSTTMHAAATATSNETIKSAPANTMIAITNAPKVANARDHSYGLSKRTALPRCARICLLLSHLFSNANRLHDKIYCNRSPRRLPPPRFRLRLHPNFVCASWRRSLSNIARTREIDNPNSLPIAMSVRPACRLSPILSARCLLSGDCCARGRPLFVGSCCQQYLPPWEARLKHVLGPRECCTSASHIFRDFTRNDLLAGSHRSQGRVWRPIWTQPIQL